MTNGPAGSGVPDDIRFNIPANPNTVVVIRPGAETGQPLPNIIDAATTIDGYTQPGASPNTLAIGNNAQLRIELDGESTTGNGITIVASNCLVRGLAIHSFSDQVFNAVGIDILGGVMNHVKGNFIGVNAAGIQGPGVTGNRFGIQILGPGGNTIGGTAPADRNLISGNALSGVDIGGNSPDNFVLGNYIGTNKDGTEELPNLIGVSIMGATGRANRIGGGNPGEGNVISGNTTDGVFLNGAAANVPDGQGTRVQGNFIGTSALGTARVGNGGHGVHIFDSNRNLIGGEGANFRNVISGNYDHGISLQGEDSDDNRIQANYIGVDVSGNTERSNAGNGIDIDSGPDENLIGGTGNAFRHVISGNDLYGIQIRGATTTGNKIQRNYIGTNRLGTLPVPNLMGIYLTRASFTVIGGDELQGNLISGNHGDGIQFDDSRGNAVSRNLIGTDFMGTSSIGNGGMGIRGERGNEVTDDNTIEFNRLGWNGLSGIYLAGVNDSIIRGNEVFENLDDGIVITGAFGGANLLYANYIGTDATGAELPNLGDGVRIAGGAYDTRLGDPLDPNSGNIIRYNYGNGVAIDDSTRNWLWWNTITDQQIDGVAITNSCFEAYQQNNFLQGNTILDNLGVGVWLSDTSWNLLFANVILTNVLDGVRLEAASDNQIGSSSPNSGNVIWSNGGSGINVVSGYRNWLSANSIYVNGGLGIDLGADGVTMNDNLDPDSGANERQNFPVITHAYYEGIHLYVEGFLNSRPNSGYTIEWFYNDTPDPSEYGEGQEYKGSFPVWTDASGNALFTGAFLPTGEATWLTMTATDAWGNTSEFSHAFYIEIPSGGGNSPIILAAADLGGEDGDGDGDSPLFAGGGQIQSPGDAANRTAAGPVAPRRGSALQIDKPSRPQSAALRAAVAVRRQPTPAWLDSRFAGFFESLHV